VIALRKFLAACAVAFASLVPVVAQELAISAPDPFVLQRAESCCGNATSTKTLATLQGVNTSVRNLVLIGSGQSLSGDNSGTAFTPVNPTKIDNLTILNGGIYQASDPLAGPINDCVSCGPGNFLLRVADTLITNNLFDRVIIVPIGVGGTTVGSWETGTQSDRFKVAYARLAAKGIVPGLANTTFVICWIQGEQDNANGTTQSSYFNSLTNVIANARAVGFTQALVPFFVPLETWSTGTTSAAVRAAQAAIVNPSANIQAGPDMDTYNGNTCGPSANAACRQADNTHPTANGGYSMAAGWIAKFALYGPPL